MVGACPRSEEVSGWGLSPERVKPRISRITRIGRDACQRIFSAENGVEKERDAEEPFGCGRGGRPRPPAYSFGVPRTSRPTEFIKVEARGRGEEWIVNIHSPPPPLTFPLFHTMTALQHFIGEIWYNSPCSPGGVWIAPGERETPREISDSGLPIENPYQ